MAQRKQYEFNPKLQEVNKKEIERRKGATWKALELLKELKSREGVEQDFYGTLISEYKTILRGSKDEEVIKLAREGIENASANYRKALRERFSREVLWGAPTKFTIAPILDGRIPYNTTTYNELKEDITRKGITDPILVTDSYEIIDGYNRCKIAKELNLDKIPYMMVNLKTLSGHLRQRLIFDLGLGNNLNRRQLSMEDKKKLIDQWLMFHTKAPTPGRPTKEIEKLSKELKEKGLEEMPELHRHLAHSFGLTKLTQKKLAEHMGVSKRTIAREAEKINNEIKKCHLAPPANPINSVKSEPLVETHVFSNTYGRSNDRDRLFSQEIKDWVEALVNVHEIKKNDNIKLEIVCTIKKGSNEAF